MKNRQSRGTLVAAVLFVALILCGFYLPRLSTEKRRMAPEVYRDLYPTSNPALIEDQLGARRISQMARTLEDEHEYLTKRYYAIASRRDFSDPRLVQDDYEKYYTAYNSYIQEDRHFRRRVMGKRPGFFRVLATVGAIGTLHEVMEMRALVKAEITKEEFWWIYRQLMWAGLYCTQFMLDNEPEDEQLKNRLLELRENLYLGSGVSELEVETGEVTFYPERLQQLNQIPRSNLKVFLDNYLRIRYPKAIDFKKPVEIIFPAEEIMRAAANNPP